MNRFSREAAASAAPVGGNTQSPFARPASGAPFMGGAGGHEAADSSDDARRMIDSVQQLGSRVRLNKRRAHQVDRRAAAYASRLSRHVARLLDHMPNALPVVKPIPGTGASSLRHYILDHDNAVPTRTRLLVVSSDGRLRVCTVLGDGSGTRFWADYEVMTPPAGLGLDLVFDRLSAMIAQLEGVVVQSEAATTASSQALEGMIAASEARLSNAGSRLQPVESLTLSDADVFGAVEQTGLKSYGFEHRIAFPQTGKGSR